MNDLNDATAQLNALPPLASLQPLISKSQQNPPLQVPAEIGSGLPDDYLAFVESYGGGIFGVPGHSQVIRVLNVFNPRDLKTLRQTISLYQELKEMGTEGLTSNIHPVRPGLLPWGIGENGRDYFWYTKGEPADWTVVYLSPEDKYIRTKHSFSSFLVAIFHGKVDLGGSFNKKWFVANASSFTYKPSK